MTRNREHGQSLVELTLFIPILLLMLAGMIELGVLTNAYITALDASRAAARYASPLDPADTRCQDFNSPFTGRSISFGVDPCFDQYETKAGQVKSWGAESVYDTCKNSATRNFYYVAGCLAVLNLPRGALDPTSKTVWTANDYPGDDIVVVTIPISNGLPVYTENAHWWSLYGNQPSGVSPSSVFARTGSGTFTLRQEFIDKLGGGLASAPASGLVVVEVYHAQPQLIKIFNIVNALAGGRAVIPDPIPLTAYTVFPLVSVEP
jgi:hypothetical protein